jgi:hypothetical protein
MGSLGEFLIWVISWGCVSLWLPVMIFGLGWVANGAQREYLSRILAMIGLSTVVVFFVVTLIFLF